MLKRSRATRSRPGMALPSARQGKAKASLQLSEAKELTTLSIEKRCQETTVDTTACKERQTSEKATPLEEDPKQDVKRTAETEEPQGEDLCRQLLQAFEISEQSRSHRSISCEVDVATLMPPERAIGRQIRVYWPAEDAWFRGQIASYDPASGKHQVTYVDDDQEELWLAQPLERVRMELSVGVKLDGPSAEALCAASILYSQQARLMAQAANADCSEKAECLEACSRRLADAATKQAVSAPSTFGVGDVLWVRAKGWPHWPAIVRTAQDALAHGLKGPAAGQILCVQFFGEATWSWTRPADTLSFQDGMAKGCFSKTKRPAFRRAISELLSYLQAGVLPDAMQPQNNDSGFSSDDDDDVAAQEATAARSISNSDWQVNNNLTVHRLGRIEFLHPRYHDEKHIWPLGFSSTSSTCTEGTNSSTQTCECEILEAADGSGPLFRITHGDCAVESKDGPQGAWQKLLHSKSMHLPAHKASETHGLQLFGLSNRDVARRVQQLPNANRLEKYRGWPGRRRPNIPMLTTSERRTRNRLAAEMHQLPEGIVALGVGLLEGPRCDACGGEDEVEENVLLQCDGPCQAFVHQECCGVLDRPNGAWTCDLCKLGCTRPVACALCPRSGAHLLRTKCGRWCHAACGLWIPEAFIDVGGVAPVVDISKVPKARLQLCCRICKQSYGACIQCGADERCCSAFHPLCARSAGLHMDCVHDEHFDIDSRTPNSGEPEDTSNAPARKRRKTASARHGTAVGDGTRLVCYCRKHRPLEAIANGMDDAWEKGPERQASSPSSESLPTPGKACLPAAQECSRLVPFDHALRRSQRAPEFAAAAEAKRTFLKAEAYLVTTARASDASHRPPSSCIVAASKGNDVSMGSCAEDCEDVPSKIARKPGRIIMRTISERYWEMRVTERQRVALGKSAIHGWGAISRVRHARGEMVIEYSGELIRPSVADVRERQLYDRLVGAGTYIFRMNDDLCVDATRAGNLAHMLNHSCEPNCFSRTIQVRDRAGRLAEHVVIFAREDIEAGRELTYDYRFASAEALPCNCGASNCRGLVNKDGGEHMVAPRAQLKRLA